MAMISNSNLIAGPVIAAVFCKEREARTRAAARRWSTPPRMRGPAHANRHVEHELIDRRNDAATQVNWAMDMFVCATGWRPPTYACLLDVEILCQGRRRSELYQTPNDPESRNISNSSDVNMQKLHREFKRFLPSAKLQGSSYNFSRSVCEIIDAAMFAGAVLKSLEH